MPMNEDWVQTFVQARDGTRLFAQRNDSQQPLTTVLCDGIACDGFIWRFLFEDLAPFTNIVHWNYRGHGRSASFTKNGLPAKSIIGFGAS